MGQTFVVAVASWRYGDAPQLCQSSHSSGDLVLLPPCDALLCSQNRARSQFQWEVYGHILEVVYSLASIRREAAVDCKV